jgi:hypothetical protein
MEMFISKENNVYYNLSNNSDLKQLDLVISCFRILLNYNKLIYAYLIGFFNYLYMSMNDKFRISSYDCIHTLRLDKSDIPLYKASNFNKLKQTKIQIQQLALIDSIWNVS